MALYFSFGTVWAQEVAPAPLEAPAPEPKCLESRYFKIILNHIVDENGVPRQNFYLFVTRHYVDGKYHEVIGDHNYINTSLKPELTYNKEEKLYYLKWKSGEYPICITAPYYTVMVTPYDYEWSQWAYRDWFIKTYPEYLIPKVRLKPLSPSENPPVATTTPVPIPTSEPAPAVAATPTPTPDTWTTVNSWAW